MDEIPNVLCDPEQYAELYPEVLPITRKLYRQLRQLNMDVPVSAVVPIQIRLLMELEKRWLKETDVLLECHGIRSGRICRRITRVFCAWVCGQQDHAVEYLRFKVFSLLKNGGMLDGGFAGVGGAFAGISPIFEDALEDRRRRRHG